MSEPTTSAATDIREYIAHTPKYTDSPDELADLAAAARALCVGDHGEDE